MSPSISWRCALLSMLTMLSLNAIAKTETVLAAPYYGEVCATGFPAGTKFGSPGVIMGLCNAYAPEIIYPKNPLSPIDKLIYDSLNPSSVLTSYTNGEAAAWNGMYHVHHRFPTTDPDDYPGGIAMTGWECPDDNTYSGPIYVGSPTGVGWLAVCVRSTPNADPPAKDCKKCGNPVAYEAGVKIQEEVDYVNAMGQRFMRTYRSDTYENSQPYDRYALIPTAGPVSLGGYSERGAASGLSQYFRFSAGGTATIEIRRPGMLRQLMFNATTLAPTSADLNDRLTANPGGGWRVQNGADDSLEFYDATGQIVSMQTRTGQTQSIATVVTPSTGTPVSYAQAITDDFGRTLTLVLDGQRRLQQMTDPAGGVYTYQYDALGNQIKVTYPDLTFRQYHFENTTFPRKLTGITDENGVRYATFGYDNTTGRATSTEHAGGVQSYQFAYNLTASPPHVTITDPLGTVRQMDLTAILGTRIQTNVTQPCGIAGCSGSVSAPLTLDPNSNVTSRTDFNGNRACYKFNERNLETVRGEGLGTVACPSDLATWTPSAGTLQRKTTTTWHDNWRLPRSIREPKLVTTFAYNGDSGFNCASGGSTALVCRKTVQANDDENGAAAAPANVGAARELNYTYNALGQVLTVDGSRTDVSDVTTYAYYANNSGQGLNRGMLNTVTNAAGHVTTLSNYDAHGNAQTIVDANGLTTTLTYDLRQRLKTRTTGGELTTYDYDNAGQLIKVTMPDLSFVQYFYDNAHRLYKIQDTLGNKVVYELDNMGNRTKELYFDAANDYPVGGVGLETTGHVTSRLGSKQIDALNRLWKDVGGTVPASQVTENGYDNTGNLKTVKDALNRVTTNFYDVLNRLTRTEDPLNGSVNPTLYEYNGQDQLTKVTDPKGLNTVYTYNGHGDLLTQVSPDTGTTTFTYDAAGNVLTKQDARSVTATYSYDALNRIATITYPSVGTDAAEVVTYTYDSCTNGKGRLCSVTDKTGTTTWSYNVLGRITSKSQTVASLTQTVNYGYNAAGQLNQVLTPAGNVIAYTYQNNRVISVSVNGQAVLTDAVYEPFGPNGGWKWGNSTVGSPNLHLRVFDKDYRAKDILSDQPLTGITPTLKRTIDWDYVSRIGAITDPTSTSHSYTYGYDTLDRLASATPGSGAQSFGYTYDGVGNRLTSTTSAGVTTYNYPSPFTSHRLQSLSGVQAKSYTYDAVGNMLSDGATTWSYGGNNRSYQVQTATGTIPFLINALGQRVRKGSGTTAVRFVYDEQGRLLGEYDQDGALVQETVWLNDLPVAVIKLNTAGDFGGDGKADMLWRNVSTGQVYLQPMNGFTPVGGDFVYTETDLNWRIVAQADFDGDRKQDLLWRNVSNGQVFMQLLDGAAIKSSSVFYTETDLNWRIVAAKDLDGDGKADIVWSNVSTGQVYLQYMNGLTVASSAYGVTQASTAWKLAAAGDFNGDRKADLLWWNSTTGEVKMQLDPAVAGTTVYTEPNVAWQIVAAADLDGDGKADIVWRNVSTGDVYGQLMNGTTITSSAVIYSEPNLAWKLSHTADFNGDGKTDLLWRNQTTGDVYMQQMNGLTVAASQVVYNEPNTSWRIVPAQDPSGQGQLTQGDAKPSSVQAQAPGAAMMANNGVAAAYTVVYYVHPDHLGTPRAITRPSDNKLMWKWENAEPFGDSMPDENPSGLGNFEFNPRFGGVTYYDKETGTFYNWNRFYRPATGRYDQSDPIGLVAGLNTYAYVSNDPLGKIDPDGLREMPLFDPQPTPQPPRLLKSFTAADCEERYMKHYYPEFINDAIPSFSLLSAVDPDKYKVFWATTLMAVGIKGLPVGGLKMGGDQLAGSAAFSMGQPSYGMVWDKPTRGAIGFAAGSAARGLIWGGGALSTGATSFISMADLKAKCECASGAFK